MLQNSPVGWRSTLKWSNSPEVLSGSDPPSPTPDSDETMTTAINFSMTIAMPRYCGVMTTTGRYGGGKVNNNADVTDPLPSAINQLTSEKIKLRLTKPAH